MYESKFYRKKMSMGSSWQNFSKAVPPERGAFPLDFTGKCNALVQEYLSCLKSHNNNSVLCKPVAKKYFECRMDQGLLEKQEMKSLGFRDTPK
jgi:cytochrome c oxidase assembly protein subunit 19